MKGFELLLKMGSIRGDSQDKKLKDAVRIDGWKWAMSQSSRAFGTRGAAKAAFDDLVLTKRIDCASPVLFQLACSGRPIREGEFVVRRVLGDKLVDCLAYSLRDIIVVGIKLEHDREDAAHETVHLRFARFRFACTPVDERGTPGPVVEVAWDIRLNQGAYEDAIASTTPPRPRRPPEPMDFFPVQAVDEAGKPVEGVHLLVRANNDREGGFTNGSGMFRYTGPPTCSPMAWIASPEDVDRVLKTRSITEHKLPTGGRVVLYRAGDPVVPFPLTAGAMTTLVLAQADDAPGRHEYSVAVYDHYGRPVPGVKLAFDVDGRDPSATTDASGVARLRGALKPTGTVAVESYDHAIDKLSPSWSSPPPMPDLAAIANAVQVAVGPTMPSIPIQAGGVTNIMLRREVVCLRLIGMHFDNAKCFMLPSAIPGMRKLVEIYKRYPNANLLIVGHTDSKSTDIPGQTGEQFNRRLSLERAVSVAAYLTDDVGTWLPWYNVTGSRQWGQTEDDHMLSTLPHDGSPYLAKETSRFRAIQRYQGDKGRDASGSLGADLRSLLVADYMARDGTTLPPGITLTAHGCGPYFPDVPSGPDEDVPANRRVEIFVFDGPILPPPPGPYSERGSIEYPAWKAQVTETVDFETGQSETVPYMIVVLDHAIDGPVPTAGAEVQIEYEDGTRLVKTPNDAGEVRIQAHTRSALLQVLDNNPEPPYRVFLDPADPSTTEGSWHRLVNLGYVARGDVPLTPSDDALQCALQLFQATLSLPTTGQLDMSTAEALRAAHDTDARQWRERGWASPPVENPADPEPIT